MAYCGMGLFRNYPVSKRRGAVHDDYTYGSGRRQGRGLFGSFSEGLGKGPER